jgi:hypothetical protein
MRKIATVVAVAVLSLLSIPPASASTCSWSTVHTPTPPLGRQQRA